LSINNKKAMLQRNRAMQPTPNDSLLVIYGPH